MKNNKFDKNKYDQEYAKKHLSQINLKFPKEYKEKFYLKLQKEKIKPIDFFKKCIDDYMKKELKK